MDNAQIADNFSLLAKLSDVHGENSFKVKAYSSAAFTIDKLTVELSEVPKEKLFYIKGIGESTGKKVLELLETGALDALNSLIEKTPDGILEMLTIKGIGPKKIATIWKEMEIETVGELLYACKENRLKLYKGFGEKTQLNVTETLDYYLKSKGSFLYAQVASIISPLETFFATVFANVRIAITGPFKRQFEIIHELELVVEATTDEITKRLAAITDVEILEKNASYVLFKTSAGLKIKVHGCDAVCWMEQVFYKSGSPEFEMAFRQQYPAINYANCINEEAIFNSVSLNFIPSFLRESPSIIEKSAIAIPNYIKTGDIKGIIHSHSNWSDGNNTLGEMANAAIAKGLEYLVITDHSKSAFYANGLKEDRIQAQHVYIDELNSKLAPFKIFKSIESDILNDGSLDYSDAVLSTFDLVIASVHSNLKMSEDKAMMRLLNAIKNPYTTILGHLTGRLLLSRKGYPVDHRIIIDACAANGVVIELNANPSRLDIDWRHIEYALEKNVLISINPDAHKTEGFDDTRYGVLVAQKAMLTKEQNLSSFGLNEFEAYLRNRKLKKNS